jgi:hypothetical protein
MIFLHDFFTCVKFFLYSRDNAWIINEILHTFVSFSKKLLPCLQADFLLPYLSPNIIFNPKRSWSFVKGLVI